MKALDLFYGLGGWSAFHPRQCERKRGYGLMGLYCKQHAKRHPAADFKNKEMVRSEKKL